MKRSQGDQVRSAFELLVVEHHVQVRAFGRSLGVDPEWVDDIAQEAFLTAYRDWKTFDSTPVALASSFAVSRQIACVTS